jgi:hypothetical protein
LKPSIEEREKTLDLHHKERGRERERRLTLRGRERGRGRERRRERDKSPEVRDNLHRLLWLLH